MAAHTVRNLGRRSVGGGGAAALDAEPTRDVVSDPVSHPVLVVDDRSEVRALLARMLEGDGFAVVEASNGEEALALLGHGLTPRVIVLDLWMPIVDGWEFMARARTRTPVVVITGVEEETHPLPACVVRFLKKPIGREDLRRAIADALGTGGEARS